MNIAKNENIENIAKNVAVCVAFYGEKATFFFLLIFTNFRVRIHFLGNTKKSAII